MAYGLCLTCRCAVALFPGPACSSLAVQNSCRGPGLIHHVLGTRLAVQYMLPFLVMIQPVSNLQSYTHALTLATCSWLNPGQWNTLNVRALFRGAFSPLCRILPPSWNHTNLDWCAPKDFQYSNFAPPLNKIYKWSLDIASFPGPAQFFVACSTWGEPGNEASLDIQLGDGGKQ